MKTRSTIAGIFSLPRSCGLQSFIFGIVLVLIMPTMNVAIVRAQDPGLPNGSLTTKTITTSWQKRKNDTHSVKFVWTRRQELPRSVLVGIPGIAKSAVKNGEGFQVSEMTCVFLLSGEKARFEMRGEEPSDTSPTGTSRFERIFIFDGVISKEFSPPLNDGDRPQGIIRKYKRDNVTTDPFVAALMWNLRPTEMFPMIDKWIVGSAKGDTDNESYITLTGPPNQPFSGVQEVLWVNPRQNYAIVRHIRVEINTKRRLEQVDLFLSEDTLGGWVPHAWTTIEAITATANGIVTSKMTEYSMNYTPQGDEFVLNYPPGTLVSDGKGNEFTQSRDHTIWLWSGFGFLAFLVILLFLRRTGFPKSWSVRGTPSEK